MNLKENEMIISNGMIRNATEIDKNEVKTKEDNTTQAQSCENSVEIHKENGIANLGSLITGLSSMIMTPVSLQEIKELDDCYHDLNARLMVVEKLVDCLVKKGL